MNELRIPCLKTCIIANPKSNSTKPTNKTRGRLEPPTSHEKSFGVQANGFDV
ncbi:hypothetical protein HY992_05695 [Candidatus Micrarchaeota archaeon]|nr:hypothetical protein [Candidatus Micrarchaeota archaeon]